MPLDQTDHLESSPCPEVSSPEDQAGRASSQAPGPISYLGCSPLWQLRMVRLVLRVRERGERNPAQCCRYSFRRILRTKITTVKKLLLEAECNGFKNVGITQMAKFHLLLGHDSVSESPICTWYSSPVQPRWFMRTTIALSARQFSTRC